MFELYIKLTNCIAHEVVCRICSGILILLTHEFRKCEHQYQQLFVIRGTDLICEEIGNQFLFFVQAFRNECSKLLECDQRLISQSIFNMTSLGACNSQIYQFAIQLSILTKTSSILYEPTTAHAVQHHVLQRGLGGIDPVALTKQK